jgi:hypothetical protein
VSWSFPQKPGSRRRRESGRFFGDTLRLRNNRDYLAINTNWTRNRKRSFFISHTGYKRIINPKTRNWQ